MLTCSSTWQISTEPFWAAACRGVRLLCWSLWKLGSRLSTAGRARHQEREGQVVSEQGGAGGTSSREASQGPNLGLGPS